MLSTSTVPFENIFIHCDETYMAYKQSSRKEVNDCLLTSGQACKLYNNNNNMHSYPLKGGSKHFIIIIINPLTARAAGCD